MKHIFLLMALKIFNCIGRLTNRNSKRRTKREQRLKRTTAFSTNLRGGRTASALITPNHALRKPISNKFSLIINSNLDPQKSETYYYYPYRHQPVSSFTSRSYGNNFNYDYYYQPHIPRQYLPPISQYNNPPISIIQPLYNSDIKSSELKLIGPLLATLIPLALVMGLAWLGLIFTNGLKTYVDILVSTQQQSTIDQKYLNLTNVVNNSNINTNNQRQNQSEVIIVNGTYIIINRSGRTNCSDESLLFLNPVELDYLL